MDVDMGSSKISGVGTPLFELGRVAGPLEACPLTLITLSNLVVLHQTMGRRVSKIWQRWTPPPWIGARLTPINMAVQ